ncbi:protein kinase family protein [Rhynchospora pubera]|uniref:non-specific serine/threonine protein kinase n=1 Tax=Rhynchospora pubera TaxID=906938 RepID=A0AAV8F416_9POAL|nr:protein kinase family protein [Rhynchospora pubera]
MLCLNPLTVLCKTNPALLLSSQLLSTIISRRRRKMVRTRRSKREVYNEVLDRLMCAPCTESISPMFPHQLWAHFDRLPSRYAIDVHSNKAEDISIHMKLLQQARSPAYQPAFHICATQVKNINTCKAETVSANKQWDLHRPMHEIVFASEDKPKLLTQLTTLLAKLDLNIQEAHAYSTGDGYSLIIFVVEGWLHQENDLLRMALQKQIDKAKSNAWTVAQPILPKIEIIGTEELPSSSISIPRDGTDDWEIDPKLLTFDRKLATGSCGDLFRGTYCSQDVAIKVLKPEIVNPDMLREFAQEIYILRKVRHKNVVQFIGACTKLPILCIVTEFMNGGSVFDLIHNHIGVFDLSALVRIAIDVSKGMDYLHQCNIIHRDLKTANLLMDEKEVVKVADFGVARVKDQSGVMTAETGTYRWMAPEVIEHKPYDQKADVFSFGIVLTELLTGKIPYEELTPLQAAVAVVQKGLRPKLPEGAPPKLIELIKRCWEDDPSLRPNFSEILDILYLIANEVCAIGNQKRSVGSGFFSALLHRK